jgi:hypothetical protein
MSALTLTVHAVLRVGDSQENNIGEITMGLFDEVTIEADLPEGVTGRVFQTKDFECPYLEKYTLRADGRLIHHKPLYDIDPPGTPRGPVDTNYHGWLRLHGENAVLAAKFTDGALVELTRVEDDD